MAQYGINKGVGKEVEFKGLKAQYLFIFAGGLLAVFILFVVLYMIGINMWFCIAAGLICGGALVCGTFYLNGKYGSYGLMKTSAAKKIPRRIINRRKICRLVHIENVRVKLNNLNFTNNE